MNTWVQKRVSIPVSVLSDDEWRFDACPEDQRHWCDIFEHARDNKLVVEMVDQYHSTKEWPADSLSLDSTSQMMAKRFIDAFPEFPMRPFLFLPAKMRQERCCHLNRLREMMQVRVCDDDVPRAKSKSTVILEIHRNAPRSKVMKALEPILKENRGLQLPIERLHYLAKLRLYNHFGRWSAVIDYLDGVGSTLANVSETKFSKDKKKAVANIEGVLRRIV